jgi:hypothetical protein
LVRYRGCKAVRIQQAAFAGPRVTLTISLVQNTGQAKTPLPYVPLLDDAVIKLFLLKQAGGGGYLFVHDTLAKYFASLHQAQKS